MTLSPGCNGAVEAVIRSQRSGEVLPGNDVSLKLNGNDTTPASERVKNFVVCSNYETRGRNATEENGLRIAPFDTFQLPLNLGVILAPRGEYRKKVFERPDDFIPLVS